MRNSKNIATALLLLLLLGGCFQFRKSDSRQWKALAEVNETYPVEIDTISTDNRVLHYTRVGDDTSRPLAIFVHGSPGSSSNFLHLAEDTTLLSRFDILLVDRPGFGYSEFGRAEPSLQEQARLLSNLVRRFAYEQKVLIGHSLGGPIICRMAMDAPDIADGLVMIAGSVSPELEPEESWRPLLDRKILRWILPKSFRVSNQEILPAKEELQKMTELWAGITIPVSIIQGGKDKLVPPQNADYAKSMLKNSSRVEVMYYEKMDHFIPFTESEIVVSALLRFRFE